MNSIAKFGLGVLLWLTCSAPALAQGEEWGKPVKGLSVCLLGVHAKGSTTTLSLRLKNVGKTAFSVVKRSPCSCSSSWGLEDAAGKRFYSKSKHRHRADPWGTLSLKAFHVLKPGAQVKIEISLGAFPKARLSQPLRALKTSYPDLPGHLQASWGKRPPLWKGEARSALYPAQRVGLLLQVGMRAQGGSDVLTLLSNGGLIRVRKAGGPMGGSDQVQVGKLNAAQLKQAATLLRASKVLGSRFDQADDKNLLSEGGEFLRASWGGRSVELRAPHVGTQTPATKALLATLAKLAKDLRALAKDRLRVAPRGTYVQVACLGSLKAWRVTNPRAKLPRELPLTEALRTALQTLKVYRGPFATPKLSDGARFLHAGKVYVLLLHEHKGP